MCYVILFLTTPYIQLCMRMHSQVAALHAARGEVMGVCAGYFSDTSIGDVAGEIMAVTMFNQLVDLSSCVCVCVAMCVWP